MSYIIRGADGNPVLRQGKEICAVDMSNIVKGVNLEKRLLTMVGTDETRDRDGDIVKLSGWRLDNYLSNPVFLWAHDYRSVPLAAAQKVVRKRNPGALEFQLRFPTEGLYPFADMILNLYAEKIINASSVGFIPFKWEDLSEEEKNDMSPMAQMWGGRKFTDQELLELSGCAVPSNPSALQNAIKGLGNVMAEEALTISDYLMGKARPEDPETKDDVLQELKLSCCNFVDETEPKVHQVPDSIKNNQVVAETDQPAVTSEPDTEPVSEPEIKTEPELEAAQVEPEKAAEPQVEAEPEVEAESEYEPYTIVRESYSQEFGVDLSDGKDFTVIRTETLDVEGAKTIVSYLKQSDIGTMVLVKQEIKEVTDSKDSEPEGSGPVLSREAQDELIRARDLLKGVLNPASEAGSSDLDVTGAGETDNLSAFRNDLEEIKNILIKTNESFGG